MTPRLRSILFIAATVVFAWLAAMQWVQTLSQSSLRASWGVPSAPYDLLEAPHLRAAALLPASGRVSYLTDRDFSVDDGALVLLYRAQWRLTPRVLDQHAGNDWALADFADEAAMRSLIASDEWELVEVVGEGLAVLRRAEVQP